MLGDLRQRVISPSDIINLALNSLEYYSVFPRGDFALSAGWPTFDLLKVAKKLEVLEDLGNDLEGAIDQLTLALLEHGEQSLSSEFEWNVLADDLSLLYIGGFKTSMSRQLRMKAQRANYYIRSMIDLSADPSLDIVEERRICVKHPWDLMYIDDGEIYIGSGDGENVYINSGVLGVRSLRLDMPTQISKLSGENIVIGSMYHKGWHELDYGGNQTYCIHHRPVVLVFPVGNEEYFLDIDGGIFSRVTRNKILQLPVHIAWRARCFNGSIFVSVMSSARSLIMVEFDGWRVSVVSTGPVLLMNDLCAAPDGYYLIDKMQGCIYKFDHNFSFLEKKLAFGFDYGFISDPITVCITDDKIHILSWLSSRVTVMEKF